MYRKLFGLSLSLLALPALAADINYNFVEFGYQKIELDDDLVAGLSIDGDGYGLGGSFEVGESWFIGLNYARADFDFDVELDTLDAGVGWHTSMSPNSDFYALIQYVRAEASAAGFSVDDTGFGLEIGIRGMVSEKVELAGSIGYVDLDDSGDGTSFGAELLYNFTENFAGGLLLDFDEDFTGYGAGIRFYW